jgi:hypothetical protein
MGTLLDANGGAITCRIGGGKSGSKRMPFLGQSSGNSPTDTDVNFTYFSGPPCSMRILQVDRTIQGVVGSKSGLNSGSVRIFRGIGGSGNPRNEGAIKEDTVSNRDRYDTPGRPAGHTVSPGPKLPRIGIFCQVPTGLFRGFLR